MFAVIVTYKLLRISTGIVVIDCKLQWTSHQYNWFCFQCFLFSNGFHDIACGF